MKNIDTLAKSFFNYITNEKISFIFCPNKKLLDISFERGVFFVCVRKQNGRKLREVIINASKEEKSRKENSR